MSNERISLVFAPAGSGKSTLLGQFAREFDRVVWVTVDESDRAPGSLRHMVAASSEGMITFGPQAWEFKTGASSLLVLDDIHLLARSSSVGTMLELLWALPPEWSAAVAGRTSDGLGISQLRSHPSCAMFTWEHLRFGLGEIERLFASHYKLRLAPSELPLLARNSGGWVTALHLFYVAARSNPDRRSDLLTGIRSQSLALRRYLIEQVLGGLTANEMQTLAHLAVFEYLRGDLITDFLGSSGVDVVSRLHKLGLLSATGIPKEYQLHQLLRDQLLEQLVEMSGHNGLISMYQRAAAVLEGHGELGQAARAYLRAGRIEDVERLGGAGFSALRQVELDDGVAGDQWALWTEGILELRRGAISSAARLLSRSRSEFDTVPLELRRLSSELEAWLDPPTVPEPARPMGALRRWLEGDDAMSELLNVDRSLAGTIFRSIARSLKQGEPVWPEYAGSDRLAQLIVGLVGVMIQLLMNGAPDARSLRRLELLLQTGVRCSALERILIALSVPWIAAGRRPADETAPMEYLQRKAIRDGDLFGSGVLRIIDEARSGREALTESLAELGLARLAKLVRNTDDEPLPSPEVPRLEPETYTIRLLGTFELAGLEDVDTQNTLRPQQRAVLQVLALHATQWVQRERLLEWFWPEADRDSGTKRLATAISAIRKALTGAGQGTEIRKQHDSYSLDPGEGRSDLALLISRLGTVEVEAPTDLDAAVHVLRQCIRLHRGPLLSDSIGGEWLNDAMWELDGRWERALRAVLSAGLEQEYNPLLEMLPDLVNKVTRSDSIWQLAISYAEQLDSPLLAGQLRHRYRQLIVSSG